MHELYDAASGPAAAPAAKAPAAAAPPPSRSGARARARREPARPRPSPRPPREAAPPAAAPEPRRRGGGPGDLDGARLVALNMALNGESRAETERYLAENFELPDRLKLIDEVYAAVEG